jgi:hypothetical protein
MRVTAQTSRLNPFRMGVAQFPGTEMTKGKQGNKEVKKPKKVPAAPPLVPPAGQNLGAAAVASLRKKKW